MDTAAFTGALGKAMLTYHALFGVPIKEANWASCRRLRSRAACAAIGRRAAT
jgi:hypothetical protein